MFDIDQIFAFLGNYGAKIKNKYFSLVDENGFEKFRVINALNPEPLRMIQERLQLL